MRKVFCGFLVLSVLLWLIAALPSTAMARNHKHRGARPHLALAAHNDDDEDGEPACGEEPDDADQLAAVRAMAAEQCDCDSASNHDGYVSCVDEVADAADLEVRCEVDGAVMQQSRTSDLLFNPAQIVSYASQAITLRPGDLIATGTCGGVGDARKPPVYLQPGNLLRTWIEGVGECLNQCVAEK